MSGTMSRPSGRQTTDGFPLLSLASASAMLGGQRLGPFQLAVASGERIAVLGPSGAGKSTLLRIMSGDLPVAGGQVHLAGVAMKDWSVPALARRRAVLPQSHAVAFPLPVDLIAGLGRITVDPDPARQRIVRLAMQLARAHGLSGRVFQTLSGGEQARVHLARVMAQLWDVEDGLILVDEPVAALDPGLQFSVLAALSEFAAERGHAVVAVLHDLNQAFACFDRLWMVSEGRVIHDVAADGAALPLLERLFGVHLECLVSAEAPLAVVVRGCKPAVGGGLHESAPS